MISYLNFRDSLKRILKPATALLLVTSVCALSNPAIASPLHHHHPPNAPEVNPSLVLIPIAFAIMLLSSRQMLHRRSGAK